GQDTEKQGRTQEIRRRFPPNIRGTPTLRGWSDFLPPCGGLFPDVVAGSGQGQSPSAVRPREPPSCGGTGSMRPPCGAPDLASWLPAPHGGPAATTGPRPPDLPLTCRSVGCTRNVPSRALLGRPRHAMAAISPQDPRSFGAPAARV